MPIDINGYDKEDEIVPGHFLVRKIGSGGFGVVWSARTHGGLKKAIKIVDLRDRQMRRELRSLLRVMTKVNHPHVCKIDNYWLLDDLGNVVEEPAETTEFDSLFGFDSAIGGATEAAPARDATNDTLKWEPPEAKAEQQGPIQATLLIVSMGLGDCTVEDRLEQHRARNNEGLPLNEVLKYMGDAAEALDYLAEKDFQHRDIKPSNLLLVGGTVQVCDFGIARDLRVEKTAAYPALDPRYAAPEQWKGQAFHTTDEYALALTYCHLRTGALPFEGDDPSWPAIMVAKERGELKLDALEPAERKIIRKATSVRPDERYPSCTAMVDDLKAAFSTSAGAGLGKRFWFVVAALILAIGVAAGFATRAYSTNQKRERVRRDLDLLVSTARNMDWQITADNKEACVPMQELVASIRDKEILLDDPQRQASFLAVSALLDFYVEHDRRVAPDFFDATFEPIYTLQRQNGILLAGLEPDANRAIDALTRDFRQAAHDIKDDLNTEQIDKLNEIYPSFLDIEHWKQIQKFVRLGGLRDARDLAKRINNEELEQGAELWIGLRNPQADLGANAKGVMHWLDTASEQSLLTEEMYCEALDQRLGSGAVEPKDIDSLREAMAGVKPESANPATNIWHLHVTAALAAVDPVNVQLDSLHQTVIDQQSQLYGDLLASAGILLRRGNTSDVDLQQEALRILEAARRSYDLSQWPAQHPFRDLYTFAEVFAANRPELRFSELVNAEFQPVAPWFRSAEGASRLRDVVHFHIEKALVGSNPLAVAELPESAREAIDVAARFIEQVDIRDVTELPIWIADFTDDGQLTDANRSASDNYLAEQHLAEDPGNQVASENTLADWLLVANTQSHAMKARQLADEETIPHRLQAVIGYGALLDWTGGCRQPRSGFTRRDIVEHVIAPGIACWEPTDARGQRGQQASHEIAKLYVEAGYVLHLFPTPTIRRQISALAQGAFPNDRIAQLNLSSVENRLKLTERMVTEAVKIDSNQHRWWISLADVVSNRPCKKAAEYQAKVEHLKKITARISDLTDDPRQLMYMAYTNILESRYQVDRQSRLEKTRVAQTQYKEALQSLHEPDTAKCHVWLSGVELALANYDAALSNEQKMNLLGSAQDNANQGRRLGYRFAWQCLNAEGNALEDMARIDWEEGREDSARQKMNMAQNRFSEARNSLARDDLLASDASKAFTALNFARCAIRRYEYGSVSHDDFAATEQGAVQLALDSAFNKGSDIIKVRTLERRATLKKLQLHDQRFHRNDSKKVREAFEEAFVSLRQALAIAARDAPSELPHARMEMVDLLEHLFAQEDNIWTRFEGAESERLLEFERPFTDLVEKVCIEDRQAYTTADKIQAYRTGSLLLISKKITPARCWEELDELATRIATHHENDQMLQHYLSYWKCRGFIEAHKHAAPDLDVWQEHADQIRAEVNAAIQYARQSDDVLCFMGLSLLADYYYEQLFVRRLTPPTDELDASLTFCQSAVDEIAAACSSGDSPTARIGNDVWNCLRTIASFYYNLIAYDVPNEDIQNYRSEMRRTHGTRLKECVDNYLNRVPVIAQHCRPDAGKYSEMTQRLARVQSVLGDAPEDPGDEGS